jgi:signal transduction histidine kinase
MITFAAMSYVDRRAVTEARVLADISRTEERLTSWIRNVQSAMEGFRRLAEQFQRMPASDDDRKTLENFFRNQPYKGGFAYDRPAHDGPIPLGNILALRSAGERLARQPAEWVMLRRLFPFMGELLERNPHILWLHYVSSSRDLGAIYPWVSADTLMTGFGVTDMGDMYRKIFSAQRRNKRGISFDLRKSVNWSEPYVDAATGNTTVTVSGQVQEGRRQLRGFVGMDIQLAELDELLKVDTSLPIDIYLVDEHEILVAEANHDKGHLHAGAEPLVSHHPDVAHWLATSLLQGDRLTAEGQHLLAGKHLSPSPWRVLFVIPKSTFAQSVWLAWQDEAIAFALALLAMLLAFMAVDRWLTGPAIRLARYTQEARNSPPPQGLPRIWRPWFIQVYRKSAAMRRHHQRLSDELRQVRRRCEQLDTALESQRTELQSFLYSISHDLRAPLRGISGFGRVIQDEFSDRLGTSGKDALERLQACSQRAMQIVEGLLSLSRMTRRPLIWEDIDLSGLAQDLLDELLREVDVSAEILVTPGMTVLADKKLMRVIMSELLDNAVRFRSPDRPLHLRIGSKRVAGQLRFYVQDNSIGASYADEHLPFRPFTCLHPSGRVPVGEGLGLARVRHAVRRMRGDVVMESHEGEGTVVWFWVGSPGDESGQGEI